MSVRFRTANELWVVNHISSSISIVDVAKRQVIATLDNVRGPADVAFAGAPLQAFVTCANDRTVQVFDPLTHVVITNLVIDGERPKAMAVSRPVKVYVAIFESGNGSTILSAPRVSSWIFRRPGQSKARRILTGGRILRLTRVPILRRPSTRKLPSDLVLPRVGQIVRKNRQAGGWMTTAGTGRDFVPGTKNASLSGRVAGWDLPDPTSP